MKSTINRALRIKLIVPRGSQGEKVRRALLQTHIAAHEATRACEEMLLTFRQGDVSFEAEGQEISRPASYYVACLEEHFRQINLPKNKWERARTLLKKLYTLVVRSSVGLTSTATDIERFFRPLLQESEGARPKPIHLLVNDLVPSEDERKVADLCKDQKLIDAIVALFEKDPSLARNKKPSWDKFYHTQEVDEKTGQLKWIRAFFNDWLGAQKRFGGREDVVGELTEMGLLPFQAAYFAATFPEGAKNLWAWDRMALNKAVGHLNSWESWTINVEKEKEKLRQKVVREIETPIEPKALALLEGYQKKHGWEIRNREIRGWDKLREWLRRNPRAKPEQITDRIGVSQRQRGEYGSGLFLTWAASKPLLWQLDQDPVRALARRNGAKDKYARARCYPRFTYSSFDRHPTGVDYDIPSNCNNPKYELVLEGKRLSVTLPLFLDGQVERTTFACAPSKQLRRIALEHDEKGIPFFITATQDGLGRPETFSESLPENKGREKWAAGGAALTLERSAIAKGQLRDVFLRVARRIELDSEGLRQRKNICHWLHKTEGSRSEAPDLSNTVCLAVDLNQRAAAAVSAFKIVPKASAEAQYQCTPLNQDWVIVPLYSRILKLPGEGVRSAIDELRPGLNKIRTELSLLKALRKLAQETEETKREELVLLLTKSGVEVSDPQKAYEEQEKLIVGLIHGFQTSYREHLQARHPMGGLSLKKIEFLEDYVNVLKAWFHRATPNGKRTERKNFCRKLLAKIQHLKDDRAKKIADAITQAARGLYWTKGKGWEQVGPSATVVVMEELRTFRPVEERTPAQNRRLARWNHRTATKFLEFQLAEYAIPLTTTTANYTSLFESTGTPGVRCQPLTKRNLATRGTGGWLDRKLGPEGLNLSPEEIENLKPGDLIPDRGAAVFVTMHRAASGKRHLVFHNADTNAAARIGLNFLTGYKEPVYLKCVPGDEEGTFESRTLGTRLELYFGSSAMTFLPENDGIFTPVPVKAKKMAAIVQEEETEEEGGSNSVTLLRDPTGVFFRRKEWVERGRFFGQIKNEVLTALRKRGFSPDRQG